MIPSTRSEPGVIVTAFRPVIVARPKGGLGNQMVLYARARRLSLRLGLPIVIDLAEFGVDGPGRTPRSYALDMFRLPAAIADPESVKRIEASLVARAWGRLNRSLAWRGRLPMGPVIVGRGVREVEGFDAEIRSELTTYREPLSVAAERLRDEIKRDGSSVAVHVRRTDYIGHPALDVCDADYYAKAIALAESLVADARFFVFSDDLDWCRGNLAFRRPVRFVDSVPSDREEFRVMGACSHFVIANSTFSWWAAWLSERPGEVIAPGRWSRVERANESVMKKSIMPGWRTIPIPTR